METNFLTITLLEEFLYHSIHFQIFAEGTGRLDCRTGRTPRQGWT